jgi:hypothetical protein
MGNLLYVTDWNVAECSTCNVQGNVGSEGSSLIYLVVLRYRQFKWGLRLLCHTSIVQKQLAFRKVPYYSKLFLCKNL